MTRTKNTKLYLYGSVIALVGGFHLPGKNAKHIVNACLNFLIPSAEAVVGRPVTPVSYAGVARRTARRN